MLVLCRGHVLPRWAIASLVLTRIAAKVAMINQGLPPVIETGLSELLAEVTQSKAFTATESWQDAILGTDVALVCVGTPSSPNGSLSMDLVKRVSEQIGTALAQKQGYFVVAIRSTVLPGTVEGIVIPILEAKSGKKAGRDFGACMVPELLREGTSVKDFFHPPRTVIGELDSRSGETVAPLFDGIERASDPHQHSRGGEPEVRGQCLSCSQGDLRERSRQHLQERGLRQPSGDEDLLHGQQAEPVALLPEAGVCLRRLLPAEGSARTHLSRAQPRCGDAAARFDSGQQ